MPENAPDLHSLAAYQAVVVGAGPVGCILAERLASELNWKVLLLDKRSHIGGNCYDKLHESGVLIHRYGPHYFRTNNPALLDYLSRFTDWIEGNYFVKSAARNELFPFPINLNTLRQFFRMPDLDAESANALLQERREPIEDPQNSEEFVLSRVGQEMYETFYLNYTLKQWGIHPRDLAPSVCGRIPIRFNEDERYVDHQFQKTPAEGFTAMFRKMINHPNITLALETDYRSLKELLTPDQLLIYTGPIDEYFDYSNGRLPWRSLKFEFKAVPEAYVQPCVQINYPNEHDYTRTVEIKHVTGQQHPHTVISYEYPTAEGDPYYPIPMPENAALYETYAQLAAEESARKPVYFCGRLAEYRYFNMDEVMERALATFQTLQQRFGH
ncbi:MAG: UDP-galactopyranose mutase [Sphingobacteriales bacterium]|nr:MAG: UDP-galactopyranose mutase [Sphingobacteriales bacterium]